MRTRSWPALAAVPLVLTLALAGCGAEADSGNDGVASVTGDSKSDDSDSGSTPSQEEIDEAALEFAECMREHGIDMDDPKPGEGIRIKVDGMISRDKMNDAMQACEDIMPKPPAGELEDQRDEMLEMAECMREHGVEAFPDPKPGEGINIGPDVGEDPDFESAQEECAPDMGRARSETAES